MSETDPALTRLLNAIYDIPPRREPMHERDCAACDASDEIAGVIACYWDTFEDWAEVPAVDGLAGDTVLTQLARMAAHVLHRRMPGYRRPSSAAITEAIRDDRRRGALEDADFEDR